MTTDLLVIRRNGKEKRHTCTPWTANFAHGNSWRSGGIVCEVGIWGDISFRNYGTPQSLVADAAIFTRKIAQYNLGITYTYKRTPGSMFDWQPYSPRQKKYHAELQYCFMHWYVLSTQSVGTSPSAYICSAILCWHRISSLLISMGLDESDSQWDSTAKRLPKTI